jgi:Flp pilus assembly protein TadD
MALETDRVLACKSEHVRPQAANSYIATAYFNQATALLMRGLYGESESYFREVLRLRPDHAGALNNLGTSLWRQGRAEEAEVYYRRGLILGPADFGILNNLGNAIWEQGRPGQAVPYYRQALEVRPDARETRMNLGVALSDIGEFDEALAWIQAAMEGQPDWPDALDNLGVTLSRQGKLDEALHYYEQALRLRPDFPLAHRNRAHAWLAQGDFERGWVEYEWRLKCPNCRLPHVDLPRWLGEPLEGRSILLCGEQGIGDVLQFLRFVPEVQRRGGRVVLACADPLVGIAARCQGADQVVNSIVPLPDCQVHSPLMSLPAVLGMTLGNLPAAVPYLTAVPSIVERWEKIVEQCAADGTDREWDASISPRRALRIGIAWQGNSRNRADRWRSIPLRVFAHLAEVPGVRLISLQKGEGTEQIAELAGRFSVAVLHDPEGEGEDRRDLLDTAAIMQHLDLVVTPDTAIAHLAGALGVKVWLALPAVAEWRWMIDREDSPWYPTMTLFRQTTRGDWDGVFQRMAARLSEGSGADARI